MNLVRITLLLALLLTGVSCATMFKAPHEREPNANLTETYARWRSARVSEVKYNVFFNLKKESTEFTGRNQVEFNLSDNTKDLTIDFNEGKVVKLVINGKESTDHNYTKAFITLKKEYLIKGTNKVDIHFDAPYTKNGDGLYKFTDNVDGRVYLYTNFEPYDGNKLFPIFDQPDLKATYTMSVEAPKGWHVITSKRESSKKNLGNKRILWSFPTSEKFSTYIFSLHAGPYKMWTSKAGKVPLRLFARRSLAKHVKIRDWFGPTKKGFEFFNEYFDYEYPFHKYDQIIVPDFNAGAMENVGAVTFSEWYVKRGKKTRMDRFRLANVIYHEMAHMWFGNLVTMDWWNGLWLNESFATYMAYLGLYENTEFKESWNVFYGRTKGWAYWEDQNVTTHPIELEVPSTDDAFTNFDGITYGKGASSLKQLAFYIGPDNFKKGIRQYFKTHAYKNTQLMDFIGALDAQTPHDLKNWSHKWLETASLNTITAQFSCANKKVTEFNIIQTAPSKYPTIRPHKTIIGLYTQTSKGLKKEFTTPVLYNSKKTAVPTAVGQTCPALVNLNEEDHDYVKTKLDPVSLKTVMNHLPEIKDELPRAMYWASLEDMMRDGLLPAKDYMETAIKFLGVEPSYQIASNVLAVIRRGGLWYLNEASSEGQKTFMEVSRKLEELLFKKFQTAKAGSDFQKLWFDSYVRLAGTPEAIKDLESVYLGKVRPRGFKLDQDRRWNLLGTLSTLNSPKATQWIAKEKKRDDSSRGKKSALFAEARVPDINKKKEFYKEVTDQKSSLALSEKTAIINGLFPWRQEQLHRKMQKQIMTDLYRLKDQDNSFLSRFTRLTPQFCQEESYNMIQSFVSDNKASLPPVMIKKLRISAQEDQRCINNRKLKPQTK